MIDRHLRCGGCETKFRQPGCQRSQCSFDSISVLIVHTALAASARGALASSALLGFVREGADLASILTLKAVINCATLYLGEEFMKQTLFMFS